MNKRPFTVLKFRTMKVDTDHDEHREYITSTMTRDARHERERDLQARPREPT